MNQWRVKEKNDNRINEYEYRDCKEVGKGEAVMKETEDSSQKESVKKLKTW